MIHLYHIIKLFDVTVVNVRNIWMNDLAIEEKLISYSLFF